MSRIQKTFGMILLLFLASCSNTATTSSPPMPVPCNGRTPCFLMQPTIGTQSSAFQYYAGRSDHFGVVFPDPTQRDISELTLDKWLQLWRRTPDREITVVFYDNHLLGLAREVHCFKTSAQFNAPVKIDSCVVYSFGPLPGEAAYPDPQSALDQAISHLETGSPLPRSVAAISMYGDANPLSGSGPGFFEFDGLGNLKKVLVYDSEGPKFVPDACFTCHGGRGISDPGSFLSFVPSLYTFSNRSGYTLTDQIDKFSELNTKMPFGDSVLGSGVEADLYQGPTVNYGWRLQPGFFRNVLVPYCLGCHAAMTGTLRFLSLADFVANASTIRVAVCGQHTMPASSAAYRRFWYSGFQQSALNDVLPPPGPGEPSCQ